LRKKKNFWNSFWKKERKEITIVIAYGKE